jgi:hypothetical protein
MPFFRLLAIIVCAVTAAAPARAVELIAPPASPGAAPISCQEAGAAAELTYGVPPGLLAAIGRMESGRYDAGAGRVVSWPWTINALGVGHYFDNAADAIAAVQDLQMQGVYSVDVGCFQINMLAHPTAFATLQQAFDPASNAEAAARFLSSLHDRTGSWESAVAWYHSATPGLGEPYRDRVLADWSGGGMRILPAAQPGLSRGITDAVLHVGASGAGGTQVAVRGIADPYVRLASWQSHTVHIWTPTVVTPAAHPVARASFSGGGRLPRVITPGG